MSRVMPWMEDLPVECASLYQASIRELEYQIENYCDRLDALTRHLLKRSWWLFYRSHSPEGPEFWYPHASEFLTRGSAPRAKWQIPLYDLFTVWAKWSFCKGADFDIIEEDLLELENKHELARTRKPKPRRHRRWVGRRRN